MVLVGGAASLCTLFKGRAILDGRGNDQVAPSERASHTWVFIV
jgi:hypothetical protein